MRLQSKNEGSHMNKIAMIGIYGGIERDFNPGNVMIAYYTYVECIKRIKNVEIDVFSLDFTSTKTMETVSCFENADFKFLVTFFSEDMALYLFECITKSYSLVILGGDIILGLSNVFFLEDIISKKEHPPIIMNCVSTLWRSHLISLRQKEKVRLLAEHCEYIAVREHYVKQLLIDCGVSKEIRIVPDPVLLHCSSDWETSDNVQALFSEFKRSKKKIVGISECWVKEKYLVEGLIKSKAINECSVLFFPYSKRYHHKETVEKYRRILGKYCKYIEEYLNPWETFSLISNLDFCICNALHNCIAALTTGIPFLGIDPSPFFESRHTEILLKKDLLAGSILKLGVIENDHNGETIKLALIRFLQDKNLVFDCTREREALKEHFDTISQIYYNYSQIK